MSHPALPRPFPTPSFGGAAHVRVVKLAAIWQSSPSGFPYKQPHFTVSLVVPVEIWKSTPPSLQSWLLTLSFFLLYYSIEVSSFYFCMSLLFWLSLTFFQCNWAATHPSGSKGPAHCSHQMFLWLSGIWELLLEKKPLVNMIFMCLTLIYLLLRI